MRLSWSKLAVMALATVPAGLPNGQSEAADSQAGPTYPVLVTAKTRANPEVLAKLERPGKILSAMSSSRPSR